jgi:hypothetical protein
VGKLVLGRIEIKQASKYVLSFSEKKRNPGIRHNLDLIIEFCNPILIGIKDLPAFENGNENRMQEHDRK